MDPWAWTAVFLGLAFLFAFLELFITSGGILAFLSAVSLLASVFFAFGSGPGFGGAYTLGVILGVPVLLWYLFRWWPRSRMGRQILLNPDDDPALAADGRLAALKKLVGKRGVVRSKMLLSGLVEIEGTRINAVSESEPLEPGEEIVVIRVDGIDILVRKASDFPDAAPATADERAVDAPPRTVDDPFA